MNRSVAQLWEWSLTVPREPLLAIWLAEALQLPHYNRAMLGRSTLFGLPVIVMDLPPTGPMMSPPAAPGCAWPPAGRLS